MASADLDLQMIDFATAMMGVELQGEVAMVVLRMRLQVEWCGVVFGWVGAAWYEFAGGAGAVV